MLKAKLKTKDIGAAPFLPCDELNGGFMKRIIPVTIFLFCLLSPIVGISAAALENKTTSTSTTPAATSQQSSFEQTQQQLNTIKRWHLSGKIAVQTHKDAGSADIHWARYGDRYMIALYGTFGSNGIHLSGHPGHIIMMDSQGHRYEARSAEQLLGRVWGYHVPISNLNYWVRGMPAPGHYEEKKLDRNNRLVFLRQAGWFVHLGNYTRVGKFDLPTKIFMTSHDVRTKLIIYQWHVRSA